MLVAYNEAAERGATNTPPGLTATSSLENIVMAVEQHNTPNPSSVTRPSLLDIQDRADKLKFLVASLRLTVRGAMEECTRDEEHGLFHVLAHVHEVAEELCDDLTTLRGAEVRA